MESRRPRTERSAFTLADLPRDPEELAREEALEVRGGFVQRWIHAALTAGRPSGGLSDESAKLQLQLNEANSL